MYLKTQSPWGVERCTWSPCDYREGALVVSLWNWHINCTWGMFTFHIWSYEDVRADASCCTKKQKTKNEILSCRNKLTLWVIHEIIIIGEKISIFPWKYDGVFSILYWLSSLLNVTNCNLQSSSSSSNLLVLSFYY